MPYLVCDPMVEVTEFEVSMDGVPSASFPQDLGDGTVRLRHDVTGVDSGNHSVEVRAKYGAWGWSDPTPPFGFTKPSLSVPSGISLEE